MLAQRQAFLLQEDIRTRFQKRVYDFEVLRYQRDVQRQFSSCIGHIRVRTQIQKFLYQARITYLDGAREVRFAAQTAGIQRIAQLDTVKNTF